LPQLQSLAGLEPVTVGEQPAGFQSVLVPGVRVGIDTSGAIDVGAERARLGKLLATAVNEVSLAEKKLADPAFTGKAPQPVIDGITARLRNAQADVERITAQLDELPAA
ncbi:MAG: valyl-tRNA synthetase, partial [Frankiales bacterium]|nr:valyl-tRNA synthetase [Frankiales bacterium]